MRPASNRAVTRAPTLRWPFVALIAVVAWPASGGPGRAHSARRFPRDSPTPSSGGSSQTFSEPDGTFHSDNLVSNEDTFPGRHSGAVTRRQTRRRVLGVGPEQNFTYIAALKPAIVFIPTSVAATCTMHLLYKALIELSADARRFPVAAVFAQSGRRD